MNHCKRPHDRLKRRRKGKKVSRLRAAQAKGALYCGDGTKFEINYIKYIMEQVGSNFTSRTRTLLLHSGHVSAFASDTKNELRESGCKSIEGAFIFAREKNDPHIQRTANTTSTSKIPVGKNKAMSAGAS